MQCHSRLPGCLHTAPLPFPLHVKVDRSGRLDLAFTELFPYQSFTVLGLTTEWMSVSNDFRVGTSISLRLLGVVAQDRFFVVAWNRSLMLALTVMYISAEFTPCGQGFNFPGFGRFRLRWVGVDVRSSMLLV